jgi:hypothetical protein
MALFGKRGLIIKLQFFFCVWGPGASDGEKYFFAIRPAAAARTGASGRWKPEGKERPVVLSRPCGGGLLVGVKRALAFIAPRRGEKRTKQAGLMTAGWVMHEYRVAAAALHKNVSTTYRLL